MKVEQWPPRNAQEIALAEQMRSSVETLRPPIARLVVGGLACGGRMRRVRRMRMTALAVIAAITAIASGAVAMKVGGVTHQQAESGMPAASLRASARADHPVLIQADVRRVASDLLPDHVTAQWDPPQDPLDGSTVALGLLTGPRAAGQVTIRLSRGMRTNDCPDHTATGVTCSLKVLPDGSTLRLEHNFMRFVGPAGGDSGGAESTSRRAVYNSAQLIRPNGIALTFLVIGTAKQKSATEAHPQPALTVAQLKSIVTDQAWTTLPAPHAPRASDAKGRRG